MKLWNEQKVPFVSLLLFSIFIIMTACSSDNANTSNSGEKEDDPYVIRFSHVLSEDTPLHAAALEFKEELEDKSEGRVEVELFANGQLYSSERETIEAIQIGNIEMSQVATPVLASFKPEFSSLNLPFLFDSREEAHAALDGELGDALTDLLPEIDLIGLGYGENGFRHFLNNEKPIEKPEDISGLKVRVIENKMYEDLFNSLGANASPLGFGETYTALQQGVFDGVDSEITVAATAKFDEVLDYLTLSSHTYTATISLMNKEFFETLPEDLQEIVAESAQNLNKRQRELNIEGEEERLENLKKVMEVNELTSEQKEVFKEKLEPVFNKYAEDLGGDIADLVKEIHD